MGRHSGPPPPPGRLSAAIPGRSTATRSAGVLLALTGVVVAVLTVTGIVLMGVPLLPRPAAAAASPTPSAGPSIDRVALLSSPAQTAVSTVLAGTAPTGWTPAGALAWTGGTPFDAPCGRPTVDAALSGARVYDLGRSQVVLTVSAYTAGSGAVAMVSWAARLTQCTSASVSVSPASGPSTDAFVATLWSGGASASALFWRRGDVIAIVATTSSSRSGLTALATAADPPLVAALTGVCANLASTVADAARSPWVERDQFTGLTAPVTVSATPSPTPVAPQGVTPLPDPWTPSPLPSVSYPVRPADPVYPVDLPTAVGSPVPPSPLAPAPSVSVVPSRLDDPVGPGCGWAFTGQLAPPYDAASEAQVALGRVTQAQQDLSAAQQAWQASIVGYWQSVGDYQAQAAGYVAYQAAVRRVAQVWDVISAQRQAYADAVTAYNLAAAARQQFLLDQASAQTAYDQAVAACQSGTVPTGTPTPTDTALPVPTDVPTDTAAPLPSDVPTVAAGCPPPVPAILSQPGPSVPPVPTPPPTPTPPPPGPSPTG